MAEDADEPTQAPDRGPELDGRTGRSAAAARMQHQNQWVDLQLRQAVERGDFDDLPGYGKPLDGLGQDHDPDWWIKQLIEREQITGVLPPSLQLRKDAAELDARLDAMATEKEVRSALTEFNERVHKALYGNPGGPPLVTRKREVDAELVAWRQRRVARLEQQRAAVRTGQKQARPAKRWLRRAPKGGE